MLIVMFVIAILILIFIPNLSDQRTEILSKRDDGFEQVVASQYELYLINEEAEPTGFGELATAGYLSPKQLKRAEELWENLDDFLSRND